MIIGVISDTHGNRRLMYSVADLLVNELKAEVIFHLGDDYPDAEELRFAGYPVRMVPGLWCDAYRDPKVPKVLREEFDGITIACAHADKDLRAADRGAGLVMTGHTHSASVERHGPSVHVNPGHLKGGSSRGAAPSFALVEVEEGSIRVTIMETQGLPRFAREFRR